MRRVHAWLLVSLLVPSLLVAQRSDRQQLIDRYTKDLKSRDARTRAEAAEGLGDMNEAAAVDPLIAALRDNDPSVREAAASGLWNSSDVAKPAIPALRKTLDDTVPSVVIRAAGALIAMDEEPSTMKEPLHRVLGAPDPTDRFMAARALIGVDPAEQLAGPIIEYLRRNTGPDRHDAFESGEKALRRLAETQEPRLAPIFMNALGGDPRVTNAMLLALGGMRKPPERWTETLVSYLSSPSSDVRGNAVDLLGKQTAAPDVKVWAIPASRLVADKEQRVRNRAIHSLMEAKGLALPAISPVINAVKTERDDDVRATAAEAVGEIADASFAIDTAAKTAAAKEAFPVLQAAAKSDPNPDVRRKAMHAVDKLQLDPATIADFLATVALTEKERYIRLEALSALQNHGKEGASVESRIAPLKNDPDELTRNVAKSVIEAMHSDRFTPRAAPAAATSANVDPAARDKALEYLREHQYKFNEEAYFSALNEVEPDIVKAFLDAGMSPNYKFASSFGNPAMRVVLEAEEGCGGGARPTPADAKAILKMLLARGGDPNIADDRGNTPLMEAAAKCDAEVVKTLLAAKANMNAKNISDMTAFEFGLLDATEGAAALAAAGFRLSPAKVKIYNEAYAKDPKRLALVKKATKTATK